MQARGVLGVSLICLICQLAVKSSLANAGLITSRQENRVPVSIEGESYPPYTPIGIEPQFFHSGVSGQLQVIHVRASQQWTLRLQQSCPLQESLPNGFRQRIEFEFEVRMKSNRKTHKSIMVT